MWRRTDSLTRPRPFTSHSSKNGEMILVDLHIFVRAYDVVRDPHACDHRIPLHPMFRPRVLVYQCTSMSVGM